VPAPVLILCNARSGSTLLRYVLDTHPDISAPAETPLGSLCSALLAFTAALPEDSAPLADADAGARASVATAGRALIDTALRQHAERRGAAVWCDKSIHTLDHLEAVAQVFPDARYLCLHRHAMDAIASGLEASRWGFKQYGYARYVRARPGSTVAALAQYWIDRTTKLLDFERSGRCSTHRVRYEDLVSQPEQVTARILRYLALPGDEALVARMIAGALRTPHDPGAGDFKIDFSSSVGTDSVGRGRDVPVGGLERGQRREMNALLSRLDYELVDDGWNRASAPEPAADSAAPAS
jgi:protein-tyrosine sulfotransferase